MRHALSSISTNGLPLLGVMLAMLQGCLIPTDFQDTTVVPNRTPHIDINSVIPAPWEAPVLTPNDCRALSFQAAVSDADNDRLYWRVYGDYRYVETNIIPTQEVSPRPGGGAGSALITFSLNPQRIEFEAVETLYGIRAHVVELLVSDRPFENNGDSRSVPNEAMVTRFSWTFIRDASGVTCDEQ